MLEQANLQRALKQVRHNKGAPGIDGMSVDELPDYLRHHWPEIRVQLETGRYRPQPVRRVEIPKSDGESRPLGIPTVLDRFIQQAIAQVISAGSVQTLSHFCLAVAPVWVHAAWVSVASRSLSSSTLR